MNELDLVALLSSRLCHDLVGPVGAINNGLEVLVDESDADMQRQAIELLVHSAGEAARRLKFYRLAYGASGGEGVPIGQQEAREAALGLFEESKISLVWPEQAAPPMPAMGKGAVKLLLNMIVVGAEALARGGTLAVALEPADADLRIRVSSVGPGAGLNEETQRLLDGDSSGTELQPRSIQPFFTYRLAADLGSAVSVDVSEVGRVEIAATLPRAD
jgi:histidine phosphotransferase ChpT